MCKRLIGLVTLLTLVSIASAVYGQSGRTRGATGKPPVVEGPADSSPVDTPRTSKSSPPKIVDGERIYSSKELDQRPVIQKKPTPGYTREARRHLVHGTVILRAILASSGSVTHIEVLTGLPDGLTEKAIEAARKIKFEPGMKDGKPASIRVELEYHFNVY